jgi:excisionase family DNA binding protein
MASQRSSIDRSISLSPFAADADRDITSYEPTELVNQLIAAVLATRSAHRSTRNDGPQPMLTVAQTATALGVSRMTVIRKADSGELPCVVVSRGQRQKLRRFPRLLIEELASRGAGGLGELTTHWLGSVARSHQQLDELE